MTTATTLAANLNQDWWLNHLPTLLLAGLVLIQWVALQGFIIHYHFFRKSLIKPTPDGIRFALLERAVAMQSEQTQLIFTKLAEMRKDVQTASAPSPRMNTQNHRETSLESSFVSMGEVMLKKRLQEMKVSGKDRPN